MNTYIQPATVAIAICSENMIATSGTRATGNMGLNRTGGNGVDLTREQKSGGFGSGMWEDMK